MRTFSLYIHSTLSAIPALMFEIVSDEAKVRLLAERALSASPDRLLVEVREEDRLRFSIDRNGVAWTDREHLISN
jgi:hypothetical protein